MTDIRQQTRNGEPYYPLTHVNAIVGDNGGGVDAVPTTDSQNLVRSGGVKAAIDAVAETVGTGKFATGEQLNSVSISSTITSGNEIVKSSGIKTAIDDVRSYAETMKQNPPYIGDDNYWYVYDYDTRTYVRKSSASGDVIDWSTLTDAQKEVLMNGITSRLVVATQDTCRNIVSELE